MLNYNFIAPYYHSLSRIIFFNRQHLAHFPILNYLKEGDKVLWIGGGAGKFIPELEKLNIKLEIDYIDFSSEMIKIAEKNKTSNCKINFITSDIFNYQLNKEYDVVMTTFLFDHFKQEKAQELFLKINRVIKNNGIWFYVDFSQNQKGWQKGITSLMLIFFKIVIGLNINQLPKMKSIFEDNFELIHQELFFRKYIESLVWRKKK
ncbi:Methyltransferase domain-containing protein [Chishuiella changwenlii]|uniref:Methyltransferase domain-containing protein n=1 Tax=Chishuiella changwenlii TaxID=1434701 RepID=A0A1M6X6U3_9FLAO|nr:hypothetical protein GCM10010984_14420 [Chishuiella changwenlii]SHL01671.1 Methyltransferase domain-containing protein [Chishuiella changwenlii]